MDDNKWLETVLDALDGHTAVTRAEAEAMLKQGFKPFDEFIAEVKQELDKRIVHKQRD